MIMTKSFFKSKGTIRRKLLLLATISVTVALLVACSVFAAYGVISLQNAKWQQLESQANLLALNSAAAVEFADTAQADRLLAALRSEPSIMFAALFSADGTLIGSYPNRQCAEVAFADAVPQLTGHRLLTQPITSGGETIGTLKFQVDFTTVGKSMRRYSLLTLIVGLVSWTIAVSVAFLWQRGIVAPIDQLASVARKVADEGDYGLRVEGHVDGELGDLFRAFNGMLTTIQSSKQQLQEANDRLEQRVLERTAELERARDAAEAASRAKSDFLANMSHEIRTPLNAIMGYADLLRRGWIDSPEERDEMLSTVHSSGKHLMTVINDILDLSKIESGRLDLELVSESPHHILSEVVSLMRVSFREKNLDLDYNWDGPIPERITTDSSRLRQILFNLLGNARKFTPSGGVQLIARVDSPTQPAHLIVDVIDTGVGIPREKQEQVFEPFMQADTTVTRKYGGTGLGLSISRRLARMMGGDLTLISEPGNGSNFQLKVSTGDLSDIKWLSSGAVGDIIPSSRSRQADVIELAQLQGLRVLVVDDGLANRKLISLVLTRAGAKLAQAENGRQACDLALGGREFDVILLDMQMPIMDGYVAARTIRDAGVTTPIIALTAHAMKGDREKCLSAGCSDFLTKPVNTDELLARLSAIHNPNGRPQTLTMSSVDKLPIRSRLPTDDPEFAEIVIDFSAALEREVARLDEAVRNRDPVATLTAAHWIKGSGGTSGFPCFTNPASQICEAVRKNDWSDIDRHLLAIVDYAERIECPELELVAQANFL